MIDFQTTLADTPSGSLDVDNIPLSVSATDANHRPARWRVIDEPVSAPVFASDVAAHLRLSAEQLEAEAVAIELMIDAATDYAEAEMGTSLVPRVIEANFYDGEPIILPRGPVIDVASVTDADGNATTAYVIEHYGRMARIVPTGSLKYPVSVTYRAGYESYEAIPASIRLAILAHVGSLFEARESTADKQLVEVPHSLAAFYRRHNRNTGVG